MRGDTQGDYWFGFVICSVVFPISIGGAVATFQNGSWGWFVVALLLLVASGLVLGGVIPQLLLGSAADDGLPATITWSVLSVLALAAIVYRPVILLYLGLTFLVAIAALVLALTRRNP